MRDMLLPHPSFGNLRWLVKIEPEDGLTGQYIQSARVVSNPTTGAPEVAFTLNRKGTEKFARITQTC